MADGPSESPEITPQAAVAAPVLEKPASPTTPAEHKPNFFSSMWKSMTGGGHKEPPPPPPTAQGPTPEDQGQPLPPENAADPNGTFSKN